MKLAYQPKRAAYSLIELMVVISISSILMVITTAWIIESMKHASLIRDRSRNHQNALRLTRDFRDDVHRAETARLDELSQLLLQSSSHQSSSGQSIVYRFVDRQFVDRQTFLGDHLIQSQRYPIDDDWEITWDTQTASHEVTMLAQDRRRSLPESTRTQLFVTAQLGRFERITGGTK